MQLRDIGRASMAPVVALLLLCTVAAGAPMSGGDELAEARKTFDKTSKYMYQRVAAAKTLLASGKKVHRKRVTDAVFDITESPTFCKDLLHLVRPHLVDVNGAPLPETTKRVHKLAGSSNPDKELHAMRIAAWLGVGGLNDALDELIDDALALILKKEGGAPKKADKLARARLELEVATQAYLAAAREAPSFIDRLELMAARVDSAVRLVAFDAFVALGVERYFERIGDGVGDTSSKISKLCVDALVEWGDARAVPLLFQHLTGEKSENGLAAIDTLLLPKLFRLTGKRIQARTRWESWWRQSEADFEALTAEDYKALVEKIVAARSGSHYGPKGSFFGYAPKKDYVIFVIDTSGSMRAPHQTLEDDSDVFLPQGVSRTRLDVVKEQVLHALEGLGGKSFDIVTFNTGVKQWSPGGSKAFPSYTSAVSSARKYIDKLAPTGSTAMYAALQFALGFDAAREVVLLSDGAPSSGVTSPDKILADVKRWNKRREVPVDIHCIGLGFDAQLLEELGAITPDSSARFIL